MATKHWREDTVIITGTDDLDTFIVENWWCPSDNKICLCPGPCPNGTEHQLLPQCEECGGRGFVNFEKKGKQHYEAQVCDFCQGRGALPPGWK